MLRNRRYTQTLYHFSSGAADVGEDDYFCRTVFMQKLKRRERGADTQIVYHPRRTASRVEGDIKVDAQQHALARDRRLPHTVYPLSHCFFLLPRTVFIISTNELISALACPTKNPPAPPVSTSAEAFSPSTEPPYRMRTLSARGRSSRSASVFRIKIIVSSSSEGAIASFADFPIAHTGSYATTNFCATLSWSRKAEASCASKRPQCAPSGVRSRSPMHSTGESPVSAADRSSARTASSLSPAALLSECPTMTKLTPAFLSITADTSPV